MRCVAVLVAALFVAEIHGADAAAKASATIDGGKLQFPEKGTAGGVEATTAILESCHDKCDGTDSDMRKAREGDHVRLVFAVPVTVTVSGGKLEVSELVLTQPLDTGVFWLRTGDKVVRCAKYRFEKEAGFVAWRNEARAAE